MRYYMKSECAFSVQASYDGAALIVGIDNYPLTVSLGKITPTDARTFAAMLIGTPIPWQPQPPTGGPSAIITTGATGEAIVAPPQGAFQADAGGQPSVPPPVFVPPPRLQPAIPATPVVPQLVP